MLEFLPPEFRIGQTAVPNRGAPHKTRLRVHVGGAVYPVLRFWHDGLALDARLTPKLRGLVDLYDGARHIFECLIVASDIEGDEVICSFKRSTAVVDKAPLDFWRDENAPAGLLPGV